MMQLKRNFTVNQVLFKMGLLNRTQQLLPILLKEQLPPELIKSPMHKIQIPSRIVEAHYNEKIRTLEMQLEDLKADGINLKKINMHLENTLKIALNQENHKQQKKQKDLDWKQKYQIEVQRSFELEKYIKQLQKKENQKKVAQMPLGQSSNQLTKADQQKIETIFRTSSHKKLTKENFKRKFREQELFQTCLCTKQSLQKRGKGRASVEKMQRFMQSLQSTPKNPRLSTSSKKQNRISLTQTKPTLILQPLSDNLDRNFLNLKLKGTQNQSPLITGNWTNNGKNTSERKEFLKVAHPSNSVFTAKKPSNTVVLRV